MAKECERCKKITHRSDDTKKAYTKRLNRIEGQLR